MKLVEKKCPGCGAGLKFNEDDTSVTCEYCNKTCYIQRDEAKISKVDEAHYADAFKFVNELAKPLVKTFATAQILFAVVPFVVFIIIAFITFSTFSSFKDDNSFDGFSNELRGENKKEDVKSLSKISEIDEVSMNTLHENSKSKLNGNGDNLKTYEKISEWESCGVYLLISKEDKTNNVLYDIFKKSYKNSSTGQVLEMYAAVKYTNLELSDDNIIVGDYYGIAADPIYYIDRDNLEYVHGYVGNQQIYNLLVRSQSSKYTIQASDGLYVED
jgi:hypothetical protein